MKRHKLFPGIFLIAFAGFLCLSSCRPASRPQPVSENRFEITVSEPQIISVPSMLPDGSASPAVSSLSERLEFTISIVNASGQSMKNVWFKAELNREMEPFIASGILRYSSDKFNVTASGDFSSDASKSQEIIRFEHNWNMLLTSEEDLAIYYQRDAEDIVRALKSVYIQIYWDGGSQEQLIPISFKR